MKRLSFALAFAAAVSILLSIAVSQILLALALVALLLSGIPMQWPRVSIFIGLFALWTLLSLAFSPDPAHGTPQVRKMFVLLTLLVMFSNIRVLREARWLAWAWMLVGTGTAGLGLFEFGRDIVAARAAHIDFYKFYVADRIRGFMSHWMTFSGQELYVLLLLVAFLLFAPMTRKRLALWLPCAAIVGIALVLTDTRSIWIASVVAGFWLLWTWRKVAALALPFALIMGLGVAPAPIQQRAKSIISPKKQTDSNEHRIVCWRTGWEMIKAHPLLGVGPEEIVKPEVFDRYVPSDIQRPLPEGWYGHLHNFYIHYAAERGIPATILICCALGMALLDFGRALRKLAPGRSDARFLLTAAIACVIGTMVGGVFEYNLNDTEVLTMFLGILCLGYRAMEQASVSEPTL